MEITVNVKENMLSDFGLIHIQEFLQRQLQLYELQISANRITNYLKENKTVNWEAEFDNARQSAWNEYQHKFYNTNADE